jgi:hypothetical protein
MKNEKEMSKLKIEITELNKLCSEYQWACQKCSITKYSEKVYEKTRGQGFFSCAEILNIMKIEKMKEILK